MGCVVFMLCLIAANGNLSTKGGILRSVTVKRERVSEEPQGRYVSCGKYIVHIDTMRSLCAIVQSTASLQKEASAGAAYRAEMRRASVSFETIY